jgi:hypothetical protein
MPPKQIWNQDLLDALQSRYNNRQARNMPSAFQYEKAERTVRAHRGDIKTIAQLAVYVPKKGISQPVFDEISKIMNNEKPVDEPLSMAQVRAGNHASIRVYKPAPRTGADAILLTLYHNRNRNTSMTKEQVIDQAQAICDSDLSQPDMRSGRTAWDGNKTLVSHGLMNRAAHSRDFRNYGGFGQRKDEFEITEKGTLLVERNILPDRPDALQGLQHRRTWEGGGGRVACEGGAAGRTPGGNPNCTCGDPAKLQWRPRGESYYSCSKAKSKYKRHGCGFYRRCDNFAKRSSPASILSPSSSTSPTIAAAAATAAAVVDQSSFAGRGHTLGSSGSSRSSRLRHSHLASRESIAAARVAALTGGEATGVTMASKGNHKIMKKKKKPNQSFHNGRDIEQLLAFLQSNAMHITLKGGLRRLQALENIAVACVNENEALCISHEGERETLAMGLSGVQPVPVAIRVIIEDDSAEGAKRASYRAVVRKDEAFQINGG